MNIDEILAFNGKSIYDLSGEDWLIFWRAFRTGRKFGIEVTVLDLFDKPLFERETDESTAKSNTLRSGCTIAVQLTKDS